MKLAMFSGGVVMYIAYDLTHYYLHFGAAFSEASRRMKVCELTIWTAFPPRLFPSSCCCESERTAVISLTHPQRNCVVALTTSRSVLDKREVSSFSTTGVV